MSTPILATKLYIPPPRPNLVSRPRLIERLSAGLYGKLSLISAPAGFGKTTLVSAWVASIQRPTAWLSLDEADDDPKRFLAYLIAALQSVTEQMGAGRIGESVLGLLQSPQLPPPESMLTTLLNEIATVPQEFTLVLDDYHVIDSPVVDGALTFLLEHLPPQLHLVIATREDPNLPLVRLRVRGQLNELRADDLRFTPSEAAGFLNEVMGFTLSVQEINALEARTEGWIAGLQLAAISLQGHKMGQDDMTSFIESFTGSHRFVMDYLMEEVLHQQSDRVQHFLLHTAILDRMCGPLCDALLCDGSASGQQTLEYLEQANLFIVPLDNERRWYRYHHLFAELLRQRLYQSLTSTAEGDAEYHVRASEWYEENGLELEAFHHATSANDFERAERLIEGGGMPLHFRGAVAPVLGWLKTVPSTMLDAWPSLWTAYASTLLASGQTTEAEEKLQAAEAVLQRTAPDGGPNRELDEKTLDLIGRIAAIRSTSAASQQRVEEIITYSQQALQYLHPDNIAFRTSTAWKLGYAYQLRGDRAAASKAYGEVIALGQASGNTIFTIMASLSLGGLQLKENQLHQAVQTYQRALELFDGKPLPTACEAYFGLAKIFYQWNDLDAADQYIHQGIELARQYENSDRTIPLEVLLARTKLARGEMSGAAAALTKVEHFVRQHSFEHWLPDIVAVQVLLLLHPEKLAGAARDKNLAKAVQLAQTHNLPVSQARIHLVSGDADAALALLESLRQDLEAKGWSDEVLQVMILQARAFFARSENERAVQLLDEALVLAEPSGFVRLFVDEGVPMAQLLHITSQRSAMPAYVEKLLALFPDVPRHEPLSVSVPPPDTQPLVEPLSQREMEILHLIAAGKKNKEIADSLFISLNTVRYHTKNLYGKLGVHKRTQAVAKAQALNVL